MGKAYCLAEVSERGKNGAASHINSVSRYYTGSALLTSILQDCIFSCFSVLILFFLFFLAFSLCRTFTHFGMQYT